jgi:4'-phosphopantetheinyl transferase
VLAEGDGSARAVVTPEEVSECEAFQVEADRRRALVTRALVRTALSAYVPVAPETWRFARGEFGRPEIAEPAGTGLRLNLAHTRELVVCAVANGLDLGVDVEHVKAHPDLLDLAAATMDDAELASIERLPGATRPERFCAAWTLKEAYLKARGLGLALSPRLAAFGLDGEGRIEFRLHPAANDDATRWRFALLRPDASHLLALAVPRTDAPNLRIRVLRVGAIGGPPTVEALPLVAGSSGLAPR